MTTRLDGNRIYLRPLQPSDVEPLLELVNNNHEGRRLTGTHETFTFEQIQGYIRMSNEDESRVAFAIIRLEDDKFLGEIVLNEIDPDNNNANFRVGMLDDYTSQGYGKEAIRLIIGYGFNELHFHRIDLEVFDFNERAIHVYEQIGFKREGVKRDYLRLNGEYHDAIVMSILEDEYRNEA